MNIKRMGSLLSRLLIECDHFKEYTFSDHYITGFRTATKLNNETMDYIKCFADETEKANRLVNAILMEVQK